MLLNHLLKQYIRLIFESKLPPSSNGTTTGRSGFSKNQQTSGYAGGDGRVLSKDQRIQSPDDNLYYQYMQVDGPNQDLETGLTFADCRIDPKFKNIVPKELQNFHISAKGADAEQEVQTKINRHFENIKKLIDNKLNKDVEENNNIYNRVKKTTQSW